MSWFKRRRPEFEIITNDVPMSTVNRWYIYDTHLSENFNDVAEAIGLSRISSEGEAKEIEDSEGRMNNLAGIFPFLEHMSEVSANVLSAIHSKELVEDDEDSEEILLNMHNIYKAVALSTLIGTFSSALELGIIDTNTISSETYLMEREDEDE